MYKPVYVNARTDMGHGGIHKDECCYVIPSLPCTSVCLQNYALHACRHVSVILFPRHSLESLCVCSAMCLPVRGSLSVCVITVCDASFNQDSVGLLSAHLVFGADVKH